MNDETTEVVALVDWDNVAGLRRAADDVGYELRERLVDLVVGTFGSATELEVRCYSGWFQPNGALTGQGQAIRSRLSGLTGRIRNLAVRFEYADGMIASGAPGLFPLLVDRECRCVHKTPIREQKMVDTLMAVDAMYLAEFTQIGLVTVSDDVDLAPGLAMASMQRAFIAGRPAETEVVWLRRARQTRQTRMLVGHVTVEDW